MVFAYKYVSSKTEKQNSIPIENNNRLKLHLKGVTEKGGTFWVKSSSINRAEAQGFGFSNTMYVCLGDMLLDVNRAGLNMNT